MAGLGAVSFTSAQDPELAAIERRRRMAELLQQQSSQPLQAAPNAPISPLSGLAKMLRSYTAGSGLRKADEQEKEYNTGYQNALSSALQSQDIAGALEQSGNPRARELAMQLRLQAAQRKQEQADSQATNMTDEEEKALGLPTEGVYQRTPDGAIKPVYEPPKPRVPTILTPEELAQKKEIAVAGKPEMSTQVDMKQETEEAKAVGKYFGEQYATLQDAADTAQNTLENLDAFDSYAQGVETGRLTPALTDIRALGEALGFKVDEGALDAGQAMRSISNKMALSLRNPSGGEGMPGAMSDADRNFLVQAVPGLANTPGGNRMMVQYARKLAQRKIEVAQMANDYRLEHGRLDEGFKKQVREFAKANPLFGDQQPPAAQESGAPQQPKRIRFDAQGNPIGS